MRRTRVAAVVLAAVVCGACGESASGPGAERSEAPTPSPSPSVVINPPGLLLDNVAFGRSRRRVDRAVDDLKAIGSWRPLTRHLYKLKVASRLGLVNVPDDGRLADAVLTAAFDEEAQGRVCDVMFFPNAIAQDLDRWRLYWSQGAVDDPPPTMRQLWGSVLAHELAHCLPGNPGEKVAEGWEARALAKLRNLSR